MNDETLVYFGGAVKAIGDMKIAGFLCLYGDEKKTDLDGEYFTAETDFDLTGEGDKRFGYHEHGMDVKFQNHKIGVGTLTKKEQGVWLEAQLAARDDYAKMVYALAEKGALGLSSGALSHLVRRETTGKSAKITNWPIGEWSTTVRPAEVRTGVLPLKSFRVAADNPSINTQQKPDGKKNVPIADSDDDESLDAHIPGQQVKSAFTVKINQIIDDLVDSGQFKNRGRLVKALAIETGVETAQVERILDGAARPSDAKLKGFARVLDITYDALKDAVQKDPARSIKAIFEDALADRQFATWNLWDIYAKVVRKLAAMAVNSKATGVTFDLQGKLTEVNGEYIARLNDTVMKQIADHMENGSDDEHFYLKSITDPSADVLAELKIDLDQHSQLVESAAAGVVKRFRGMHETRLKAGRVLSDKNRTRLAGLMQQMQTVMDEMQRLMDESVPMAAKSETLAAQSQFLRLQARTRQSQQGVQEYVAK